MKELVCRGPDGLERMFYLEVQDIGGQLPMTAYVRRRGPPDPADDSFAVTLQPFRDGSRVSEINHFSKEWYSRKGIGDSLLPALAHITGRPVYSSSNLHPIPEGEFRTVPAGRLWLRLVQRRAAEYLRDDDRFVLSPTAGRQIIRAGDAAKDMEQLLLAPIPPLPVFPNIVPTTVTVARFLPVQDDDIRTPEDVRELLLQLFEEPECAVYVFCNADRPLGPLLLEAEQCGQLRLPQYRLPLLQASRWLPARLHSDTERPRAACTVGAKPAHFRNRAS